MDYNFSDNISSLAPSAIREILKHANSPGMISFAAGSPAFQAFPAEKIAQISDDILKNNPALALQYSLTEGYTPLRESLREYMGQKHGSLGGADEIIITSGAQQVMDLAAKAFVNKGDVVICEQPSFIGALNTFRSYGAKLVGIPLQSDGMDMSALEDALKTEKNVKFIYTIPNFQNPTGITMSRDKRKELYSLAKRYDVLILEDNPYGEIRFAGEDIPNIKSLDSDGRVIYAGSFSKILAPGLRVGFAIANREVMSKLTVCKQTSDVHTTTLSQMITYEFMGREDFESHLKNIRNIYRRKAELLTGLIEDGWRGKVGFNKPEGGLFIWCELPTGVDMLSFCKSAVENNVALVPGSAFLTDASLPCGNFRVNFSYPSDEQIEKGAGILCEMVKKL